MASACRRAAAAEGDPVGLRRVHSRRVRWRIKGSVLAMLASLRVAPVPLRAFDPPFAPGGTDRRSAPKEWSFQSPGEWWIDHDRGTSAAAKGYNAREHLAEQCASASGAFLGRQHDRPSVVSRYNARRKQAKPLFALPARQSWRGAEASGEDS